MSQPPAALALYLLSQVLQLQPSVFLSLQPVPLTEHCTVTRRRAVTLAISKLEKQLQHTSHETVMAVHARTCRAACTACLASTDQHYNCT